MSRSSATGSASALRERLIEEVKKYPVLYDTRHDNHRDIDVRDRCWADIGDRLAENSEVLKREWKSLRDSLRQAMKKSKKGATTKAGVPCKKWRYQNKMAFVLPFMTMRNERSIKEDIKIDEAELQPEPDTEVWDPGHGDDSLDFFFASICQSTKRLPRKYQNKVKKQFLDVLLRIEDEFENEQIESKTEVVFE